MVEVTPVVGKSYCSLVTDGAYQLYADTTIDKGGHNSGFRPYGGRFSKLPDHILADVCGKNRILRGDCCELDYCLGKG